MELSAAGSVIVAPFVGSFLGVLIRRLPRGQPVAFARSRCETCGHPLGLSELAPVASFLVQGGRCRRCGASIPVFHLAIELAATAVSLSALAAVPPEQVWGWSVLGWGLLTLAWIDAEWLLLPDIVTLPLILLGLAQSVFVPCPDLLDRAAGALAGWGVFAALAAVYRQLRGREGLGGGDAKLLALAGSWLGLSGLPWVVTCAAACAAAWILLRPGRGFGSRGNQPAAFGPWLAAATWVMALSGWTRC